MSQAAAPIETTQSAAITSAASLPPFRSSTLFPRTPRQEQLPALYSDCLQALHQANSARSILRAGMDRKKQIITAIRLEIEQLEQDLALEASTRTSLHRMNLRLVEALREMEGLVGDVDQVVNEAYRLPRSRLGGVIEKLKGLVRRWRAFQLKQRQAMSDVDVLAQDGGRDA